MRAQLAQMQPLLSQGGDDARNRRVQLAHQKLVDACVHAMRLHTGNRRQRARVDLPVFGRVPADGELDNVLAADRGDQLLRRSQRDDFAVIHDGHAVAEALGFFHVMRGEDDGAAGLLESID